MDFVEVSDSMRTKLKFLVAYIGVLLISFPAKIYAYTEVDCGKIKKLPYKVLEISNLVINIMQVAAPVMLIILGSIDLLKAVVASKEDEIKKAQMTFVKRLIMAALVFFVIVIVKLLISIIGNTDGIWECVECFVNDAQKCL